MAKSKRQSPRRGKNLPPNPMPPGTAGAIAAGMTQTPKFFDQPQPWVQPMPAVLMALTPMSLQVLAQARIVAAAGQQQFATVLAQAACELRTEDAFIEITRHRKTEALGEAVLGFAATTSLGDDRLRKVFTALTGDDPTKTPWWSDWTTSRKLPHDVAHAGAAFTAAQAMTAIESADNYIAHLTSVVEKVRASS